MNFEELVSIARSALADTNEHPSEIPAPQATALLTGNGKVYTSVNDITGQIAADLLREQDTAVVKVVTVWQDDTLDLPSLTLRKRLLELNPQNEDTDILLQRQTGTHTKRLKVTMPPA